MGTQQSRKWKLLQMITSITNKREEKAILSQEGQKDVSKQDQEEDKTRSEVKVEGGLWGSLKIRLTSLSFRQKGANKAVKGREDDVPRAMRKGGNYTFRRMYGKGN